MLHGIWVPSQGVSLGTILHPDPTTPRPQTPKAAHFGKRRKESRKVTSMVETGKKLVHVSLFCSIVFFAISDPFLDMDITICTSREAQVRREDRFFQHP